MVVLKIRFHMWLSFFLHYVISSFALVFSFFIKLHFQCDIVYVYNVHRSKCRGHMCCFRPTICNPWNVLHVYFLFISGCLHIPVVFIRWWVYFYLHQILCTRMILKSCIFLYMLMCSFCVYHFMLKNLIFICFKIARRDNSSHLWDYVFQHRYLYLLSSVSYWKQ